MYFGATNIFLLTIFVTPSLTKRSNSTTDEDSLKIVHGSDANIEDYPYQVSLRLNGHHFCGGSLVSVDTVITAAHCVKTFVKSPGIIKVVAGTNNAYTGGETLDVDRIAVHHKYSSKTNKYDIASVKLESGLNTSAYTTIGIIPYRKTPVSDGTSCQVSGWGHTQVRGPKDKSKPQISATLQAATVTILNTVRCVMHYLKYGGIISGTVMICADPSGGAADSCQGDSGGPLVCEGLLTGVVSFGYGCASGNPGVYTRIDAVSSWIQDRINKVSKHRSSLTPVVMSIAITRAL